MRKCILVGKCTDLTFKFSDTMHFQHNTSVTGIRIWIWLHKGKQVY
uniref:Uncharacterized protein n=1 Tax=Anguilla anguilla TaxID=7936 RepID=A0A0E9XLN8_ANGAN